MREPAGRIDAPTLPELLRARAAATPAAPAFAIEAAPGTRRTVDWAEFAARVSALGAALQREGLRPGDRVGILAPSSFDWETAQAASLACGAVVAGLDPNYPDEQLDALVREIGLAVLFVDDAKVLARLKHVSAMPRLDVVFRSAPNEPPRGVLTLASLVGSPAEMVRSTVRAGDGAILTFSSGTTGKPKPIVYTHAQVREAIRAITGAFPDVDTNSRLLCWLPLANLFQRMINFCAVATGTVSYVIGDPREVMMHLPVARPHLLIGVPRFFERVHAGIMERVNAAPSLLRMSMHWAIHRGAVNAAARGRAGTQGLVGRAAWAVADFLWLRRLRAVFGGDIRHLVSGSAPMPRWLLEWFDAIGLPVYEAYGVSEDVVPVAMNRPDAHRLGTVGAPLPPNEVRLSDEGEILVRGPGVFNGYLGAADDSSRPDAAGFWSTGDLGVLDADGFLQVIGRKSDNFKTSTGRWVSPTRVEDCLGRLAYVLHAVVFGARRKVVAALLSVDEAALAMHVKRNPPKRGAETELDDIESAVLRADIVRMCEGLAAHERPAAVLVSADPFTISGGELTTNLKVRRRAVESRFGTPIDRLFAELEHRASGGGKADVGIMVLRV